MYCVYTLSIWCKHRCEKWLQTPRAPLERHFLLRRALTSMVRTEKIPNFTDSERFETPKTDCITCAQAFDAFFLDGLAIICFGIRVSTVMCGEAGTGIALIHCDCCCLHTHIHKNTRTVLIGSLPSEKLIGYSLWYRADHGEVPLMFTVTR